MPAFSDPFVNMQPERKMTTSELIMALRQNLASEQEAINTYLAHAEMTNHVLAKKVLIDIANEERVHAGEFLRLIQVLSPDEENYLAKGQAEVDGMGKNPPA
jgi:rubrerythrin